MAQKGDFGYGSTREGATDSNLAGRPYRDNPFNDEGRGYQGAAYGGFDEVADQISSNIFKINSNATSLERAMKNIGTKNDSDQLRKRLHSTEQDTNLCIQTTVKSIKHLSQLCSGANRQQKFQFERLKGEFEQAIQRYSTLQKQVAENVKTTAVQAKQSTLVDFGEDDDQARLLQEEREQRQQQLQAQGQVIDSDLALVEEREERILQLEADILDINEIFRDLGALVVEQGDMINNIEDNVEQAYTRVEAGQEQLEKAAMYQRKARKKMCIFVLILVIIGAILAIILGTTLKK